MKNIKSIAAGLFMGVAALCVTGFSVNAAPIVITQTIHGISTPLIINGSSQTVSGDWVFKITSDTTAVDMATGPGEEISGRFAATVTLTQSGLGLTDEPLSTAVVLFTLSAGPDGLVGWGSLTVDPPWIRILTPIADANIVPPIAELTVSQYSHPVNGLVWSTPFVLQNGTTIGENNVPPGLANLSMSMSAQLVSIPEPTTLAILGLGLAGLGVMRRKKSA